MLPEEIGIEESLAIHRSGGFDESDDPEGYLASELELDWAERATSGYRMRGLMWAMRRLGGQKPLLGGADL